MREGRVVLPRPFGYRILRLLALRTRPGSTCRPVSFSVVPCLRVSSCREQRARPTDKGSCFALFRQGCPAQRGRCSLDRPAPPPSVSSSDPRLGSGGSVPWQQGKRTPSTSFAISVAWAPEIDAFGSTSRHGSAEPTPQRQHTGEEGLGEDPKRRVERLSTGLATNPDVT